MSDLDLLDAIIAACTEEPCPETLRCPPSAPVTERTVDVRLEAA